ncbi:MAG: InlB B-repeat-containing protein, partial [Clostridia bacterium]|nr:InlB B-repeat-containing protein [Clostridia bacterium]
MSLLLVFVMLMALAPTNISAADTTPTYTVTFNANGHGIAPDALSDVVEGSKISAPTAPTADGYTFGGWYKESTCENAWDFGNDT